MKFIGFIIGFNSLIEINIYAKYNKHYLFQNGVGNI